MSDWSTEDKLALAMQRVRQLGTEKQSRPIMAKITSEYENGYISVVVHKQSVEVFFEKAASALEPGESVRMDCIASFTFAQLMGHESGPDKPPCDPAKDHGSRATHHPGHLAMKTDLLT